jgi:hypothetical protein
MSQTSDSLPPRVRRFAPWTWRKRWWLVAAPVLVMAYAASIGPAILLVDHGCFSEESVAFVYRPVLMGHHRAPNVAYHAFNRYAKIWGAGTAEMVLSFHLLWEFETFGWVIPNRYFGSDTRG